jgi:CRISPR-associated protein Cmr4
VEMYTEVVTRNKINDETGIVETGALWVEEYLPRESVLYSTVFTVKPFKKSPKLVSETDVLNFIATGQHCPKYMWIGGNITTGKGMVRLQFI